jgi:SAM-dependent methyltransferase
MSCPVCGHDAFVLYREVESSITTIPEGLDRGAHVHARIERCAECGLYRTVHLSDERTDDELYALNSLSHDASESKVSAAGASATSSSDELQLLNIKPPATLLDIGCGAGQFLLRAAAAGYDVQGIDPSPKSVAFVNDVLHFPARQGSFEILRTDERFDVLSMLGVLEHIDDPLAFLRAATERLNPDGELLVGVPNVESVNRRLSHLSTHDWDMFLEPGHLYHYGPATLRKLARNAGFAVGHWTTATITIRGKLPLIPRRYASLERATRSSVAHVPLARRAYNASLRLLDNFHSGDMLFMVLTPEG